MLQSLGPDVRREKNLSYPLFFVWRVCYSRVSYAILTLVIPPLPHRLSPVSMEESQGPHQDLSAPPYGGPQDTPSPPYPGPPMEGAAYPPQPGFQMG